MEWDTPNEGVVRPLNYVTPNGLEALLDPGARMDLLIREDGRVERVCEHGVGHPIGHVEEWKEWMGVHGCDGCCGKWD